MHKMSTFADFQIKHPLANWKEQMHQEAICSSVFQISPFLNKYRRRRYLAGNIGKKNNYSFCSDGTESKGDDKIKGDFGDPKEKGQSQFTKI